MSAGTESRLLCAGYLQRQVRPTPLPFPPSLARLPPAPLSPLPALGVLPALAALAIGWELVLVRVVRVLALSSQAACVVKLRLPCGGREHEGEEAVDC